MRLRTGAPAGVADGAPRRTHRARNSALAVGALAAVLVAVLATRSVPPGSAAYTPLGGKPAPPISGTSLVGGRHVSLAALRGRYVLVDFFASWCVPCQEEVPQIERFLFEHRARHDVAALGVDIDENAADGRAFLEHYGVTWPSIEDPSGAASVSLAYSVVDPPESYLVAPDGTVVAKIVGGVTVSILDHLVAQARAVAGLSGARPR
ncbi:MAG TPA: TlpA disulfide reductase family protein [Acidimicrobiales bacterium]|nr:TlpA disulfide reductase family protein [Acidimicrobiales bacterium]